VTVQIDPIAIALVVARVLDALGVEHTIGGSIASVNGGIFSASFASRASISIEAI
jgi:hypothetical protein